MSGSGGRWARRTTLSVLGWALIAGLAAFPASAAGARGPHVPRNPGAPVKAHVELRGLFSIKRALVTVPGRGIHVVGVVRPYKPGQRVHVWVLQHGRIVRSKSARIRRRKGGHAGYFKVRISSPVLGRVRLDVSHTGDGKMGHFLLPRKFEVVKPEAHFGSGGKFVRLIQHQLSRLHFFIPQTGVYDSGTGLALDAYHRLMGWGTSQDLDKRTIDALLGGRGVFHVRFPGHGRHAEGDLANQLLALIDGKHVYWIFPISSGKPSTPTILGDYQIYDREPGYNSEGMYYSDYFIRGYAIHGYDPAPDYPASHGCIRLPIVDAIPVYDWLALGDWVDTYY